MTLGSNCLNMNEIQFGNCLPKLVECSQQEQIPCCNLICIAPNFGSPEMCNFDLYVVDLGFTAILGDPKFGAVHMRVQHCIALTAYTWLILVINCNNEVCSHSNNAVSREFWRKKVLSLQRNVTLRVISIQRSLRLKVLSEGLRPGESPGVSVWGFSVGESLLGSLSWVVCRGEISVWGSFSGRSLSRRGAMTHMCKNITLPQTSFAGGNKSHEKLTKIFGSEPCLLFLLAILATKWPDMLTGRTVNQTF